MSFGQPGFLLLLLLVPSAAALAAAGLAWQRRARARFGVEEAQPGAIVYAAAALLLIAMALTALAAARPRFGSHKTATDERGIDLVVVLDVSQSMLADDAQPTRLGRAQHEIAALLDRMRGDRAGLVIFAGTPFARAPLTSDLRALQELARGVDGERALVAPGSDLGAAIAAAQQLLAAGKADTKAMLIVSDGEDHGAAVAPAVAAARAAGIRIYTAGAGTADGAPVRDLDPPTGLLRPRVDATGAPVLTKLDAAALTRIAVDGGGRYVALAGDGRPLASLAGDFTGLRRTTFGSVTSTTPVERFQLVAAIALVALLASTVLPLAPGARAAWRRAARLLPVVGAGLLVGALCSAGVATVNRRGNGEYAAGDYAAAIALYRTAQAIDPSRPEPYYNGGNAYDRNGDYHAAIEQSKRALQAGGDGIRAPAEYAIGNHSVGAGRLDDAREAYRRALLADPGDADAKHNLEVIDRLQHASPTPTPPSRETPPAGDPSRPGGTPGPQQSGTPNATAQASRDGTPQPSDARDLSPDQLQRALEEALAGIERRFTEEEALRILDLLDEANRRSSEQQPAASGGQPDY